MNPSQEAKTKTYYSKIIECTGKVYSNPTGKFIQPPTQGNKYILVYYDYDSNQIFAEPMQHESKESQMKAYKTIVTVLQQRGQDPTLHIMDNETSVDLIAMLQKEAITIQLVPPHLHRRNAAERAIRTFKNHLIAGLCTADDRFPLKLWDKILV